MSTFLQLCVTAMREGGLSGEIVSTVAQSGIQKVIVEAVATADVSIQGKFHNWKFLWKEWSQALDVGANTDSFNEYAAPADVGEFIVSAGATKIGGNAIQVYEYERSRAQAASVAVGTPSAMILLPNGRVRVTPIPVAPATLTAEYYSAPLRMTANTDISLIPARFHRAIVSLATAKIHAFNEDWENYKLFMGEHALEMVKLEASQLSGHITRTDASGEDNAVRAE